MNKKLRRLFEYYITKKIGTEIKCCLIFLYILCFYCGYRWLGGVMKADIIDMLEMLWLPYIIGWIQVLLHLDFDEVDNLRLKEWAFILLSSVVYAAAAYFFDWFDKNMLVDIGFWFYMVVAYLCTFLIYKIKRFIDAKHLNEDLKRFQERRAKDENFN